MFDLQIYSILILICGVQAVERVVAFADVNNFDPDGLADDAPTVLITLLVRNKAHTLPYFLTNLEKLNYPKNRLSLWIRSDHNEDNSIELLQLWLNRTASSYRNVDFKYEEIPRGYGNETSFSDWTHARFQHVINLKEEALMYARKIWADFIFLLDVDVLLTSADTLSHLTALHLPVVAPMLLSEGLYSNFWCGMSEDYYYQRTEEYKKIYNMDEKGNFRVPMVHSAVLVHLEYMGARYLTFDRERLIRQQLIDVATSQKLQCRPYEGPLDDIIIFAISANCSRIPIFVNNELPYGYILQPLEPDDTLEEDMQQLINIKMNIIHDLGISADVHEMFAPFIQFPEKHKLSLDRIYMINLERRPERRHKMNLLFRELGLDVQYFIAVDGKELNQTVIQKLGVRFLEGFEDPYHHRQMTMGEVGCFLSHYRIWEEIIEEGLGEVLILEDDIRFEPYFNQRAVQVLKEARKVEYDLIYFGRKRLKEESEPEVAGTYNLVHPGYSYWTLGYVISLNGARKLLAARPLDKLVPVDEYLPLMFNRHPNKTWAAAYPERNLVALSASPLILFPTHYTGDVGYISDTEDSELSRIEIENEFLQIKSDHKEFEFNEVGCRQYCKSFSFDSAITLDNMKQILKRKLQPVKPHEEL